MHNGRAHPIDGDPCSTPLDIFRAIVRRGFGFSANATTTRRMIARKAREREQGGKERVV
jgi:hypothetical protein